MLSGDRNTSTAAVSRRTRIGKPNAPRSPQAANFRRWLVAGSVLISVLQPGSLASQIRPIRSSPRRTREPFRYCFKFAARDASGTCHTSESDSDCAVSSSNHTCPAGQLAASHMIRNPCCRVSSNVPIAEDTNSSSCRSRRSTAFVSPGSLRSSIAFGVNSQAIASYRKMANTGPCGVWSGWIANSAGNRVPTRSNAEIEMLVLRLACATSVLSLRSSSVICSRSSATTTNWVKDLPIDSSPLQPKSWPAFLFQSRIDPE